MIVFFVLFTVLICSDSIFNLLKRVRKGSFWFLCKKLVFLFLPLNLDAQIRCPQNQYTDLKSALDQPLICYSVPEIWCMVDVTYFSFWAIFCPFTTLITAQKIKILKNEKKNCLETSSFYICIPRIMIIWCTVLRYGVWQTDEWKKWYK